MQPLHLDLVEAGKVCSLQIDESKVSGEGFEFPTLKIKAIIDCPKPDLGKITLINIKGYLERKVNGMKITHFNTDLMFEIESHPSKNDFEIIIPLNHKQIERIESYRQGQDLEIRINVTLTYHYFCLKGQRSLAYSFYSKTNPRFKDLLIPQSAWVDFLNKVGYHRIRLMEMVFPEVVGIKEIDNLYGYLEKAKSYYFKGDYNKTVEECRRVVEDIPKLHGIPKDMIREKYKIKVDYFIDDFLIKEVDKGIADHIKWTLKQLWSFSSKFHHNPDEPDEIPIIAKRADAEYVMNQTLDLAVYIGKIYTQGK